MQTWDHFNLFLATEPMSKIDVAYQYINCTSYVQYASIPRNLDWNMCKCIMHSACLVHPKRYSSRPFCPSFGVSYGPTLCTTAGQPGLKCAENGIALHPPWSRTKTCNKPRKRHRQGVDIYCISPSIADCLTLITVLSSPRLVLLAEVLSMRRFTTATVLASRKLKWWSIAILNNAYLVVNNTNNTRGIQSV